MLSLLFTQSSILFYSIVLKQNFQFLFIRLDKMKSSQNEIKMKSSKSQKNITVITDRKTQHELLAAKHESLGKGNRSCKHQVHKSPCRKIPVSCKNMNESGQKNLNKQLDNSTQKHRRQRSNSAQSKQENSQSNQNRKKQLDFLCFQRMINQFKKYLLQKQEVWDFGCLCYGQLIKLLWLSRFVSYAHQQQFIQNGEQAELKKIYLLWLSISVKKILNFRDFLTFYQVIQNVNIQTQKIVSTIMNLQIQIRGLCSRAYEKFEEDPKYTFFMKRMEIKRKDNFIFLDQPLKQKLISQFKSFKFNRLKQSGIFQCVKVQQQEQVLVSKKSSQLADQRRKKIEDKIRQKKPHVQNIDLLDLLSYRQRDHIQNAKKPVAPQKKKSVGFKRGQIKKQLQILSRPKIHFQQRREDEINFQKEQQQFTFHPKINSYKLGGKQKIMQIKNADKMLVRMKQARKLKQEKQTILQKGWSNTNKMQNLKNTAKVRAMGLSLSNQKANKQNIDSGEKQRQSQAEKQQSKMDMAQKQELQKPKSLKFPKYEVSKDYLRIPILYIDVNIEEGKKQRIIIYDNDRAEDLAREFGFKHKLSEDTIGRLQILLQQQMDTILARIEQETDDQCSFVY